jgi:hypothetical protein
VQSFTGVASGSFTAPDHEYPSYLELRLTATDSGGLRHSVSRQLDPRTVVLSFQTTPGGLQLTVGSTTSTATFSRTVIVGSKNTISAPTPAAEGPEKLHLHVLVGQRSPDPRHHRPGHRDDLHRQVPQLTAVPRSAI